MNFKCIDWYMTVVHELNDDSLFNRLEFVKCLCQILRENYKKIHIKFL